MCPPPPTSPLFPYTTLFRSRRGSRASRRVRPERPAPRRSRSSPRWCRGRPTRSEEHTSELQSHHDLVCRLLLEKKKKKYTESNYRIPAAPRSKSPYLP